MQKNEAAKYMLLFMYKRTKRICVGVHVCVYLWMYKISLKGHRRNLILPFCPEETKWLEDRYARKLFLSTPFSSVEFRTMWQYYIVNINIKSFFERLKNKTKREIVSSYSCDLHCTVFSIIISLFVSLTCHYDCQLLKNKSLGIKKGRKLVKQTWRQGEEKEGRWKSSKWRRRGGEKKKK